MPDRISIPALRKKAEKGLAPLLPQTTLALVEAVEALNATYSDVTVLLDQHVSPEVNMEARRRLIERSAILARFDFGGET